MALNNIFDNEFFDELERQITPVIANGSFLEARIIYGALYSYYKFNRGRPENILFFETALEEDPTVLHIEMSSVLFQLAHEASIMDRDRLDLMIMNFFKPNFLLNWDTEVKYKQRLLAELFTIFTKVNYLDEEVWNKVIDTAVNMKRVNNMDNYHIMLQGLNWYNENPKSPKFQKMKKEIDAFKNKIFKNENRLWKYDPDKAQWRTYEDLMKTREEIDETFVYAFIAEDVTKGDKKVVVEKKEITLDEVKKMVADKIKQNVNILKIKSDLREMNVLPEMIEDSLIQVAKENQAKNVEALRKKGVFVPDMSDKQKSDLMNAQRTVAKSAAPAGGAAKKGDDKKKK
jgi:hypothetical protein